MIEGDLGFKLIVPEKIVLSGQAREVIIAGEEGDFTLLPGHAPILSLLRPGILSVTLSDGVQHRFFVEGGVAEGGSDRAIILADRVIPIDDLGASALDREVGQFEARLDSVAEGALKDQLSWKLECLKQARASL